MSRIKKPHHRGSYHQRSQALNRQSNSNPATTCWRCGRTLAQHPPHKNGKPATWTAGHIVAGQVDGPLAPEASVCNASHGATYGNLLRKPRRTNLSW